MSSLKLKSSKVIAMLLAVAMLISMIPVSLLTVFAMENTEYFTVTVTDSATGDPIADAEVRLESSNSEWTLATEPVLTNAEGKAEFDTSIISDAMTDAEITDAALSVIVTKFGYENYSESENINIDNLTVGKAVSLSEKEKVTLSGTVTDENGLAYEGATVKMTGTLSEETTTDADGNYSFQVFKSFGEYTITATATEEKYLTATTTVAAPTENYTCTTLKFEVKQFNVSTGAGENGTITAADTVAYGEDKEVTATADDFYRIQKFEVDGTDIPGAVGLKTYTHTIENITSAKTVNVTFVRYSYKINFTVSENGEVKYNDGSEQTVAGGSVSVDKEVAIENGTITVNATPSTNYRVAKVVVNGTTQNFNENDKTYSEVFEINKDHTFEVEFKINTFTVETEDGQNGTSSVDKSVVDHDGSAVVTITPDTGYNIEKVTVNGTETTDYSINDDESSYTLNISNITENTKVVVEYSEIPSIDLDNVVINSSDALKTVEDNDVITYIYANNGEATFTTTKNGIRINGDRSTGKAYRTQTWKITESTLVTKIEVYNGRKWENITLDKNIQIVIDTKAPVVNPDASELAWTNNNNVTITGSVTDENTSNKPSSGLSYIVWSKDATLTEDAVLTATENKVVLGADGKYSFTSVDGEQNALYYIYAVDVSGNVSTAKTVKVKIDTKLPTVTEFKFSTKENTIVQDIISFLTFGTVCSEKMYVTVVVNDETITSGLKEITLYRDGDALATKDVTDNYAIFELKESEFKNGAEVSAVVTDIAGNTSVVTKPTDTGALSNEVKIDGSTKPVVTITPAASVYTDATGKLWYDGNLALTIVAKDENTGIRKVSVKLNGKDITTDINNKAINTNFSASRTTEETFVINTSQNALDGENVIEVVVTNNSGIESVKAVQKVYIDTTKPDISKFEIAHTGDTPLDKVLNFLTFGMFFDDKVEVTVTASDSNATSGVSTITLYVDGTAFETKTVTDDKATFVIPVEAITDNTMHFDKVISAKAVDFVGYETANFIEPNTSNSDIQNSGLMIETIKPTISVGCADAAQNKNSATADANDWYKEDVEFTVDVADADAGIRNVIISINDTTLVNEDLYATEVHSKQYKVKSSDSGVVRAADGSYTIKVVVIDNAGNASETYSKTIYKDIDKPYITGFDFDAVDFVEGSETASTVEVTDYGFYFKADTKVTISAKDNAPSAGVKSITYYTVDKDAGKSTENTVNVNKDGQIEFTIEANFKGQIYAKATDNVDNVADQFVNPNSAIVEDETKHKEETHIIFTKDDTEFTINDGENKELYANDVPVKLTVIDTYSGIRSIEWSVVAPYDTANNQSGKITVNNDKTFTSDSEEGWTIVNQESNLVTKMEKDIVVKNNSNNIVVTVKMIDRAGNSSEEKIEFSIDKTIPVIEVVYDNNEPDADYNDIYKADREATITITERNFRAEDIVFAITNTDKDIPAVDLTKADVWTTTVNDEDPDKTVHVAKIKYTADGDYTFDIAYKDNAENAAEAFAQHKFTIDKTIPVITVVYDNNDAQNGNYYKADRIATITIKEHNFDDARVKNLGVATDNNNPSTFPTISAWKDNGDDTHTATITYNADSKYTFDIEFVDKAGNSIEDYTPVEFYVDKTAPTLEISGVADKSANNGTVAPVVSYSDTNFNKDAVTITLTGINNGKVDYTASYDDIANGQTYTYANFEKVQKVDDIYTLTAKLTDMAGNETEKTITFSANRFGSVYDLAEVKDIISKYLQIEEDIVFTETNVDSLDREGIKIKLTKNGTPTDLVEGTDYTVEVTGGNGQWSVYKYTIKKALFADDGRYSLSIYSKDAAGNVNENIDETKEAEISFGIDKTKPVIVPIDFESGVQYAVDMKTVSVEIKDNLVLEGVKIYLNGEEIEYKVDGETYTFDIPKSNSKQDVKIVAVDAAGNEQPIEVNDFLVNTNIFVRWYNNTPLFVGSIIGVVVLALGITIFLVFFKKKKKEDEDK